MPSTNPVAVSVASPVRRAIPKSIRWACPSPSKTMLPGFTSRCSTPCSCAASRAPAMPDHTRAAATSSSVPRVRTSSPSDSPRTYSITITMPSSSASPGSLSAGTRSWICTQCGCRTVASARASRRIRSSVSASRTCAALSATVCPSRASCASHTRPKPPDPSRRTSRNRAGPVRAPRLGAGHRAAAGTTDRPTRHTGRGDEGRPGWATRHRRTRGRIRPRGHDRLRGAGGEPRREPFLEPARPVRTRGRSAGRCG